MQQVAEGVFFCEKERQRIGAFSYLVGRNCDQFVVSLHHNNISKKNMYPEEMVAPMRTDLTSAGVVELKTAEDVEQALNSKEGTTLVLVNSVCGCAAANARPAVKLAIQNSKIPTNIATVFAGVDTDATAKARTYMEPFPPSSPSIALFKDGKLVHFIERHHIEGATAEMVAENLVGAFDEYC